MTPFQLTRSVRGLNRLRHIAQVLTQHGFGHVVARINLTRFVPVWMLRRKISAQALDDRPASIGRRIAQVCTALGPTFIKLAQLMSTRPDIVPDDVIGELRMLQDDVPPFDTATAMTLIEQELGRPVDACFASIEQTPIASGSVGQVYRAKTIGGDEVVVKVRRPDVEELIRVDMQLLRWLAESLESLMPETRIYRPSILVDELDEMLTRELDYVNEASATSRFVTAFKDDVGIRIPKVFWEYSGSLILTLEAIDGTNVEKLMANVDDVAHRIDQPLVARRLADCYLKQIFEVGAFHSDPHPGNILIDPPGTVGLIDFGQVGAITDEFMTEVVVLVYGCVHNEMGVAVDAIADMGALGPKTDRRQLARALQMMLEKYFGLPLKRVDLNTLFAEFSDIIRRNDVVIPREVSMLIKTFATVTSVASRLDPDLDVLKLVKPRLERTLADRVSPKRFARGATVWSWHVFNVLRHAPGQLREALRRAAAGRWHLQLRHENLDRLTSELDRSSNRLAFSIVIAAIIVGSSVVVSADTTLTVFGFKFQYFGIIGYLIAGVLGLGLSWAIFRSGRLH